MSRDTLCSILYRKSPSLYLGPCVITNRFPFYFLFIYLFYFIGLSAKLHGHLIYVSGNLSLLYLHFVCVSLLLSLEEQNFATYIEYNKTLNTSLKFLCLYLSF